MSIKKVLLISPAHPFDWSAPPPGIGYIASSLEAVGCKVKFIDCQITPRYKKLILSLLADYPAVGISVNAGNVSSALDIARAIRKHSPQTRIIMGGPHATAVYDILIPEYADIVVRGEGEDTVTELFQTDDLTKVKGIAYWDGSLKVNPARPYIEDLDHLRFPAWHLYELKKYRFRNTSSPLAIILTSRGCPYDCIYCVKSIHGYKVRLRSIDNVLSEIDYLVTKLGVREIQIMDDIFTLYPERVKELCRRLIERRYEGFSFALGGGIRTSQGDQEMFDLLAKAGCYMADVVIESASQEILDKIGRDCKLDEIIRVMAMIKKSKIRIAVFCMLGFPFDTAKSMRMTVNFTNALDIDSVTFVLATPYAGTKFYDSVKLNGRFLFNLLEKSSRVGTIPSYEMPCLKATEINAIFKQAHRSFYFRPKQLIIAASRMISNPQDSIRMFGFAKNLIFKGNLWSQKE